MYRKKIDIEAAVTIYR